MGPTAVVFFLALLVVAGGCAEPKSAAPAPPPSVEELAASKFEKIVNEVRRRLALASSRVTIVGQGGPSIDWKTTVEDELIPPPAEDLAWRGRVTVVTRSSVRVITLPDTTEEEEPPRKKSREPYDSEGVSETGDPEIDAALRELSEAAPPPAASGPLLKVIDNDETEVYDLIFEDGRWRLTTPINEETQIGLVFFIAMKSQ